MAHSGLTETTNEEGAGMSQILLSIPDESLSALHVPPPQAGDELRMLAAVKLFEMKRLSSGAAANMAGIPRGRNSHFSRVLAWGELGLTAC